MIENFYNDLYCDTLEENKTEKEYKQYFGLIGLQKFTNE